ncbi:MAG: hypothetical protein RML94_15830 [Bacteroidia bacterium]|nr:hypothetical protein [Bacteroidia bacterium]
MVLMKVYDERVLSYLYHAYYTMVRGYILQNSSRMEDVEDTLQDIISIYQV